MLWFRVPEKIYLKRDCLPAAPEEIRAVMDGKRVFIVTDHFLCKNAYTKRVTDKPEEMGIPHPEAEFRDLAMRFMGTRFIAAIAGLKEQAFDDQCTGANPRYPLIGEIKQMYLSLFQNPVGFGTG